MNNMDRPKFSLAVLVSLVFIVCTYYYRAISSDATANAQSRFEKPTTKFQGEWSIQGPGNKKTVNASYVYTIAQASGQGVLQISPAGPGSEFEPFTLNCEAGQESVRSIYSCHFGILGDLLCVDLDYGASSQKLMVFRLDASGKINVVFSGTCRFGYKILDLSGGDVPDISGGYGDLNAIVHMVTFGWNGTHFEKRESTDVSHAHRYTLSPAA